MSTVRVHIVGGGLAGLACARTLHDHGIDFTLFEALGKPGGRVRTEITEEGFRLDRGFQVLLTAYPEARRFWNYQDLNLQYFYPGARVWMEGRFHRVADPFRHPWDALTSACAPIGSMADKVRVLGLRRDALSSADPYPDSSSGGSTLEYLRERGFSDRMIDRFFRPFLGGVFLERSLQTSAQFFQFVYAMFARGPTAVPARGMGELSRQLADPLPERDLEFKARVESINPTSLTLEGGDEREADYHVIATDPATTRAFIGADRNVDFRSTTCVYYQSPRPPVEGPYLLLDGEGVGPVNHACVISQVSPHYATADRSLISCSIVDSDTHAGTSRDEAIREQMGRWFGDGVEEWERIRSFTIKRALPVRSQLGPRFHDGFERHRDTIYLCGDGFATPSIDGALMSGRRCGEALVERILS